MGTRASAPKKRNKNLRQNPSHSVPTDRSIPATTQASSPTGVLTTYKTPQCVDCSPVNALSGFTINQDAELEKSQLYEMDKSELLDLIKKVEDAELQKSQLYELDISELLDLIEKVEEQNECLRSDIKVTTRQVSEASAVMATSTDEHKEDCPDQKHPQSPPLTATPTDSCSNAPVAIPTIAPPVTSTSPAASSSSSSSSSSPTSTAGSAASPTSAASASPSSSSSCSSSNQDACPMKNSNPAKNKRVPRFSDSDVGALDHSPVSLSHRRHRSMPASIDKARSEGAAAKIAGAAPNNPTCTATNDAVTDTDTKSHTNIGTGTKPTGTGDAEKCIAPLKRSRHHPLNPDLAACCRGLAAFLATAVASTAANSAAAPTATSSDESQVWIPTAGFIYGYTRVLFELLKLEADCCVYAGVYINRVLTSKVGFPLKVRVSNWKKILVGTLLIASKFHDDVSMKNCDFASALNGCSVARFNQLEAKLLIMLRWHVHVPISEYTRQYFELVKPRDLSCDWELSVEVIKKHFSSCARPLVEDVLQSCSVP